MTNNLEKQFFDTFGIEPMLKGYSQVEDNWHGLPMYSGEIKYFNSFGEMNKAGFHSIYDNEENEEDFKEYPQITDRILLELICIIHQTDLDLHGEEYYFESLNYKDLKEEVIAKCKRLADKNAFSEATGKHIKHQVQALFKEG